MICDAYMCRKWTQGNRLRHARPPEIEWVMSPQGVTNEGAPMGEAPMRMEGGELVCSDSEERNKTDIEGPAKQ